MSERAVSQRTPIPKALPPWPDDTPPFTRTSATPCLATSTWFLPRASPCPRPFCGVPYGRPEKTTLLWTTTFLPNSATRSDARARPIRATAPLPPGARRPACVHGHRLHDAMWRAVLLFVTASMNPHGPTLPARCFTGACLGSMAQYTPDDYGAALYPQRKPSRTTCVSRSDTR